MRLRGGRDAEKRAAEKRRASGWWTRSRLEVLEEPEFWFSVHSVPEWRVINVEQSTTSFCWSFVSFSPQCISRMWVRNSRDPHILPLRLPKLWPIAIACRSMVCLQGSANRKVVHPRTRKVNVPWSELLHQAFQHLAWRARALEVADFDETPESICWFFKSFGDHSLFTSY